MYTNLYHEQRPTQVKGIKKQYSVAPKIAKANNFKSYRLRGFQVKPEKDYLDSRKVVLTNSDCNIILAAPNNSTKIISTRIRMQTSYYLFIRARETKNHLGNLDFKYGDYLVSSSRDHI